jgi:hypothetical protein
MGENSIWAAVMDDGTCQVFLIKTTDGLVVEEVTRELPSFEAPAPPVILTDNNRFILLSQKFYDKNFYTNPIITDQPYHILSITPEGNISVKNELDEEVAVNAINDGRIVADGEGLVYILTGPTDEYTHGILGDKYEASSITVLDSRDGFNMVSRIDIRAGTVIESLYPIVYDIDGDKKNEIIVTLSNSTVGAWIAVFGLRGNLIMEGPPVGTGNRWRHHIAVAPFGPDGELEFTDVLTPHIGGVVEFYRFKDDQLEKAASMGGYSSHKIGSRNLDTALAGDFDDDDRFEILIPDQGFSKLGLVKHTINGAVVLFEMEAGGEINTNISSAADSSGHLLLGIGRQDGVLRIWHKE